MSDRPLIVLCPHFAPDTAPTGTVMTRIVAELVERGHRVHVVTSLPWYRNHCIDPGWDLPRRSGQEGRQLVKGSQGLRTEPHDADASHQHDG